MIKTVWFILLSYVFVAAGIVHAESSWTSNLYFENDLFDETDQQYTNGTRISWISPNLSSYDNDPSLPDWMVRMNHWLRALHDDDKGISRNLVFSVGQLMFTPEDENATELIENDRPYAGYLYSSMAYHRRSETHLTSVELSLGVVGPASYAQETQDLIHDLRDIDKFQGWDNQLSNEPTLNVVYERKKKLQLPSFGEYLQQDFITHGGAALGSVASYINLGGEYRIGWQLPDDFGTSSLRPGGDTGAPGGKDPRLKFAGFSGIHGFVSVDGRFVARDIFLDGNSFRDSHSVDKENWVADIALGVSTTFDRWKVSYAHVWRTKAFKQQQQSHRYGSLSFSYTW